MTSGKCNCLRLLAITAAILSDFFHYFRSLGLVVFLHVCVLSVPTLPQHESAVIPRPWAWEPPVSQTVFAPPPIFSAYGKKCVLLTLVCFVTNKFCVRSLLPSVYIQSHRLGWCSGLVVEYRARHREVAGSTHTRSTASNLEQVANLLCAQANSASNPQRDWK